MILNQQQYHLKTGEPGEQQLDNLDRYFGQSSRDFLMHAGLQEGMSVLDVGCGVGNLSCWLAKAVGATGQVVAVDNDAAQLAIARKRAQAQGISNISFVEADAHELSAFAEQFDLAYCRWLLVHLNDPTSAVKGMANALRVGGILACEVGSLRTNEYFPVFPAYRKLCEKMVALLEQSGNDIDIASRIFKMGKVLSGFSFDARLFQGVIHDPDEVKAYTTNFCLVLDSLSDAFLNSQLMTADGISQLREALCAYTADESTVLFLARMTQMWCQRLK